jgi:hypothetical protein
MRPAAAGHSEAKLTLWLAEGADDHKVASLTLG